MAATRASSHADSSTLSPGADGAVYGLPAVDQEALQTVNASVSRRGLSGFAVSIAVVVNGMGATG